MEGSERITNLQSWRGEVVAGPVHNSTNVPSKSKVTEKIIGSCLRAAKR